MRACPVGTFDNSAAFQFNAGLGVNKEQVPKGRLMTSLIQSSLIRFPQLFIRWRGEPREAPRSQR